MVLLHALFSWSMKCVKRSGFPKYGHHLHFYFYNALVKSRQNFVLVYMVAIHNYNNTTITIILIVLLEYFTSYITASQLYVATLFTTQYGRSNGVRHRHFDTYREKLTESMLSCK